MRRDRGWKPDGQECKGGGLLTYVKDDIPNTVVELAETSGKSLLKRLSVQVRSSTEGVVRVVNVYCPPVRGSTVRG